MSQEVRGSPASPLKQADTLKQEGKPPAKQEKHKVMYIMRGLPGSGKSTLCKQLLSFNDNTGVILSADDYFVNPDTKKYAFDVTKIAQAHEWNQARALQALSASVTPIFIDNTHVQRWEARFYLVYGIRYGYQIVFQEPQTSWWTARDLTELAKRNSHGVTVDRLGKMLDKWEDDFTVQNVLWAKPPQVKRPSLAATAQHLSSLETLPSATSRDASSVNPPALLPKPKRALSELQSPVQIIIGMGFPERAVHAALGSTNNDIDRALALLLDSDLSSYLSDALPPTSPLIEAQISQPQSGLSLSMEQLVSQLLPLGVKRDQAVEALNKANRDVALAASYIFNE